ncbi:fumarylpyruvate hydrolase-like [Bactrocera neohumeralis]|uniref:fumarylpyruvate hydrolase-like n=1 Tax=Bactrocera neohumeralis TaxID=98809 RepID=UPI002165FEA8|nr:fumarylpyruvate hydrolase-like [Bactrocera neohumeralis]
MVVALGPRQHSLPAAAAVGHPHHSGNNNAAAAASVVSQDGDGEEDPLAYYNLSVEAANDVIYGYGIGLDMTRRDLQAIAKENGKPWDIAKGGDGCAVLSPLILAHDLQASHPQLFVSEVSAPVSASRAAMEADSMNGSGAGVGAAVTAAGEDSRVSLELKCGNIYLSVNGSERQKGNMDCMVNTPAEVIAILSKEYVTLHAGDLIFTGTPAGVGPVRRGDVMTAGIEGIGEIVVKVV